MLAMGYVSFEPKYFRNVKKRVLPTDVQLQLTMKTCTDVRQLREMANHFLCVPVTVHFTSSPYLIARV